MLFGHTNLEMARYLTMFSSYDSLLFIKQFIPYLVCGSLYTVSANKFTRAARAQYRKTI